MRKKLQLNKQEESKKNTQISYKNNNNKFKTLEREKEKEREKKREKDIIKYQHANIKSTHLKQQKIFFEFFGCCLIDQINKQKNQQKTEKKVLNICCC